MRVSREKAKENRDLVIETAARLLRERGLDGIGVADIMKAAGLTHGGFYRSFTSKDDLTAQATQHAASSMKATLARLPDEPFRTLVEQYVSLDHRDNPGSGCVLPTLAVDAARQDNPALRTIFSSVIQHYLDQLIELSSTMPEATRGRHPGAILSEMVGAVILARVAGNEKMADQLICAVVTDIVGGLTRSAD